MSKRNGNQISFLGWELPNGDIVREATTEDGVIRPAEHEGDLAKRLFGASVNGGIKHLTPRYSY